MSELRTLSIVLVLLNKEKLDEFADFNKDLNISIKDSLKLENIDIKNEKIKDILIRFKKYV